MVQCILVVVAVISVPWMLFVKPFYLWHKNKQQTTRAQFHSFSNTGNISVDSDGGDTAPIIENAEAEHGEEEEEEEEVFRFGEIFIHQAIHTIEYCLGCISNTASYLR